MYTGPIMTEEERLSAFLNEHQEEIVNWVSNKVQTQFKVKGNMFDRTANLVNQEYPYGQRIDNMHRNQKLLVRNTIKLI
jgi:tRNA A37 threonylcarbamoyltransferase TsaD